MWNCNWGYYPGHWGWFAGHGIFGMLFSVMLLTAVISLFVYLVRFFAVKNSGHRDRNDSMAILKARYAGGEISQEEFLRMRDILNS